MAGYYNKNKDYSLAIKKAQDRGASRSEINQLRRERQNKIDAQYGGRDPYRGTSDIMGTRGSSSGTGSGGSYPGSSLANRRQDNETLFSGGTLYHNGRPSVHLNSRPWQPGMDYAAQAKHYADQGDWDAVDDVLMRRQAKIDDQGGNDRGLSNLELWNSLRGSHGYEIVRPKPSQPSYRPSYRPSGGSGGSWVSGTIGSGGSSGGWGDYSDSGSTRPGGSYQPDGGPEAYLKKLYEQRQAEAEARLRAQYDQEAASLRAHYAAMNQLYDQLRNQQAAQNDLEKMRLNEMGLANGLNTGAFGQLALGQSSAYQKAFADIGRQEAQDKTQQGWKLSQLESSYRSAVEQAQSRNQAELMDKLYREYVRQMQVQEQRRLDQLNRQERYDRYQQQLQEDLWDRYDRYDRYQQQLEDQRWERQDRYDRYQQELQAQQKDQQHRAALERAQTLGKHGDFSGYAALGYSQSEINAMRREWERTHFGTRR